MTARLSRIVGPGPGDPGEVDGRVGVDERQRDELGEAAGCVPGCGRRAAAGAPSQWRGWSTCPYIIVEELRMPSSCAVVTTSTQVAAGSLPLVRIQRTSSSRISAAVPGIESRPASLRRGRASRGSTGRCGWRR